MNNTAVTRFLRGVRRRLWLEAGLHQLSITAWAVSGTLFLLAMVHIAWRPIVSGDAAAAALIVGLIVLSPALFSRAPLAKCALRVDEHFDGHSLITTAHEFGRRSGLKPAERTVLARASTAAAEWRPQLGTLWHSPRGSSFVLAAVPAFFAVLMLQLPAQNESFAATIDGQTGSLGALEREAGLFDDAVDLPEIRDAIVRSSTGETDLAHPQRVTDDDRSPIPDRIAADERSKDMEPSAMDTPSPGLANATNQSGRSPGDARRSTGDIERQADESVPLFSGRMDQAIDRYGATVAGSADPGNGFLTQAQALRAANLVVAPTPAPAESSAWTTLTAAEVAYARRYLNATGQRHE